MPDKNGQSQRMRHAGVQYPSTIAILFGGDGQRIFRPLQDERGLLPFKQYFVESNDGLVDVCAPPNTIANCRSAEGKASIISPTGTINRR